MKQQKYDGKFFVPFKHFSERLKERFGVDILYDEYVNTCVFKRDIKYKKGSYIKFKFGELVKVYYIGKHDMYPITIYPIDEFNKNREFKFMN
jgi:hypothetical protein